MHYTHFTLYPVDTMIPQLCRVDMEDETYFITIDGKTIGWMERDYSVDFGFITDNPEIQALMPDLLVKLIEVKKRKDFGEMVKTVWKETVISTKFIDEEKLLVIVDKDMDLDEFASVVRDIVLDYVEFEEHLDLILKKENTGETVEVGIN